MNVPGFTAEASIYRTGHRYEGSSSFPQNDAAVVTGALDRWSCIHGCQRSNFPKCSGIRDPDAYAYCIEGTITGCSLNCGVVPGIGVYF